MKTSLTLTAALALAGLSGTAQAAAVLDQNALNPPGFYGGIQVTDTRGLGYVEGGQVVTTGIAGLLSQVSVLIGGDRAYPVRLSIRSVTGGVIDPVNANRLATFDLVSPKWGDPFYPVTTIDVSAANLSFQVGDKFALTMESLNGPDFNGGWAFYTDPNTYDILNYAGGNGKYRTSKTGDWQPLGYDLAFATFVGSSSAVPEPGTWMMMIVGFGAIGIVLRRKQAQVKTTVTYA